MKKILATGSIIAVLLLTLVSFSNVVGYNTVKTLQEELIESKYSFDECTEYLFETMVEISNNPEVKDLINSNNHNLFPNNHRTLLPFRRYNNRASLSVEHLELLYNLGLKIMDRIGEERVEELIENTEIPDYVDELKTTIIDNDELRERIYTLNEMNIKSETLDYDYPIICTIAIAYLILYIIVGGIANFIFETLYVIGFEYISYIIPLIFIPIMITAVIDIGILFLFCFEPSPY